MRFDASQHMKLGQQMKLAPRMIQSMEILQMPLTQLEERIIQELESNVTLEAVDGDGESASEERSREGAGDDGGDDGGGGEMKVDENGAVEDFSRLDAYESANPEASENTYDAPTPSVDRSEYVGTRSNTAGERDGKMDAMANTAARGASLSEQLREQWGLVDVDARTHEIGEQIVGHIEEDGYLRTELAKIVEMMPAGIDKPSDEEMERALEAVQLLLEPAGVAARDTRECLLLQVAAKEEEQGRDAWVHVRQLIEEHLEDLAQNRLPRVAEETGLSIDEVKTAVEKMRVLSLAPARQLVEDRPSVIVPDAFVEYDQEGDRYIAYLNDRRLPNLQLNREYALMAKDRGVEKGTREFIRKNLSNAEWLMDAVAQRKRTLLRVINVVVDAQREYFDYGPQALRPLPMTQVADQLGIHVATVSRAVSEKYLQTPRGIVPLRGFFSGGTQTASGEDVSWDAIKAAMQEVVDAEDKASPLSDEAIANALSDRGIEIARRTVAKYRGQLNIPSARLRKAY